MDSTSKRAGDMGTWMVYKFYQQMSYLAYEPLVFLTASAAIAAIFLVTKLSQPERVKVPTFSFSGPFIPTLFSRLKFTSNATTVIYGGYKKYKDKPYRLLKPDGDLIVLPNKYCEELRALPDTKLNALEATFTNHVGNYTTILVGSHLHTETIQKRLTPSLARVIPRLIDELNHAFEADFPECEDTWVAIKPYDVILRLVARAGSRVFVGESLCRDKAWLEASITFTINIFETVALLRAFPGFLHPIVSPCLPSYWRLKRQLKLVKEELLIPIIHERRAAALSGFPGSEKPDDFLQWMMDLAETETDAEAGNLAHRLLGIMSMAVVHTSAMAAVHIIYDLITMPEYLEPLRNEVTDLLPDGWEALTQTNLTGMHRLDSFMKESQRLNPPGHLSFHRIVKETITLSDGVKLPQGTHICMPSGPISMDNSTVPNAEMFDGFRWFREGKGTSTFVSTGPTSLHFGLGRYACPGRFFAAYVIKAVLSRILLDYDFRFDATQRGRPKNMCIGDKVVPNIYTDIFVKKRSDVTSVQSVSAV